ncbi:MAG: hypothetical protein KF752_11045 [Pirellulaceae bacterium]|nr:hypothetical protein [Pirellulaceae bacterium]
MNPVRIWLLISLVYLSGGVQHVGSTTALAEDSPWLDVAHGQHQLQVLPNSPTLSQALAISVSGAVIGSREVTDIDAAIFRMQYFFCDDRRCTDMPIPAGFTNVEACALSDNGVVVGYATRPVGDSRGSLRALIWEIAQDHVTLLPCAEGDSACHAQDICSDGSRITGYTTGPERLRPAIWTRNSQADQWQIEVLPTRAEFNPYLMSSSLRISPDGRWLAGCCTHEVFDSSIDSDLYVWRQSDGKWQQRLLHQQQMYVTDINNRGEVVGSLLDGQYRQPCLVLPSGDLQMLELLPGDAGGEARGINENAQIVGWSDDPVGPDGGPQPCLWDAAGKVTALEFSEIPFGMAYGINDHGQICGLIASGASLSAESDPSAAQASERSVAFRTKLRKMLPLKAEH